MSSCLQINLVFPTIASLLKTNDGNWSKLVRLVIQAVLVLVVDSIWFSRTFIRFDSNICLIEDIKIGFFSEINLIGNLGNYTMKSNVSEFCIHKYFIIDVNPGYAPMIIPVL